MLKFITGNKDKFKEIQIMLAPIGVEQVNIDLDEIQELDPYKIIRHKLKQAAKHRQGEFIVEDSCLYLSCLNNKLPGPFLKWFQQALPLEDFFKLAKKMGDNKAEASTLIGYTKNGKTFKIFEGRTKGVIVRPQGNQDFGYGPVFRPLGHKLTYGQMGTEEKHKVSSRGLAAKKLKEYLLK